MSKEVTINISKWEGKVVRHFKGNLYLVIDSNVINSETGERMVYYKALYGKCQTYIRPLDMFIEELGNDKHRFEPIILEDEVNNG